MDPNEDLFKSVCLKLSKVEFKKLYEVQEPNLSKKINNLYL